MEARSASSSGWRYDVFLNFSGEDTSDTFTSHLYKALDGAGIHTFMDDVKLYAGEDTGPELLTAIEQTRISIPIFSKNYASSKWCLNELVKIVECRKTMNQLVLPIFYHVDPSDVRNHTGTFGEALQKHNHLFPQRTMDEWKEALSEVGALKGWDLNKIANGNEGTLVKSVVADVFSKLRKSNQIFFNDLVGIQSHVENMMSLLNIESKDVKIVGVWGLGGIGKTTIAKVVYSEILHHFEGCSFLADVRETSQHFQGLVDLQNQLVTNILKGESPNITNVDEGINVIREKLCRKKVLIILDDVDENAQLDALVGNRDWFGLGSRIIITTRNVHILINHGADGIYEPSEMDENQSCQLFSKHAFKGNQIPKEYLDLSKDIVKITGGLPLALEVIGSSLFGMRKSAWRDALKMLQEIPNDKVQKKLKISFDGLTDLEKEIFLDIACFFIGMDKNIACLIWQRCNFNPEIGIEVLCQKSLVKIGENNELKMHDQLRDLGKEIIRQENPKVPGERSRLWSHKEALDVLTKHTGTNKVEGLLVDFGGSPRWQRCLMSEGFIKMTKLRLLQVDYAHFAPNFMPSFSEVIWLRWKGCPLEFTLTKFHPVNLVVLDLSYSLVTIDWMGWNHLKVAKNLKVLNLTGCQHLVKTPKLGNHGLESLILENCKDLFKIRKSINYLEKLVTLNMKGCTKILDLPYDIWNLTCLRNLNLHLCERLDKLPDSIGHLKNLKTLDASFCYIKDGGIPDAIGWLSSLEVLRLGGNDFRRLPVTVSGLSSLHTLDLRLCNKLELLPELPSNLKYFNALGCRSLKSLPRLSHLKILEVLCLDDCENVKEIPALLGLRNLERLNLDNCQSLVEIEGLEGLDSLELLSMKNCESLRKIGKISSLKKLKELRLTDYSKLSEIECLEGLDSLELLTLKGCKSLKKIPEVSDLKQLRVLEVEGCEEVLEIEGLVGLDSLEVLMIENCGSLLKIGKISSLRKLKELRLTEYSMLSEIESLEGLDSLELLTLKGCKSLRKIPELSGLKKLRTLDIEDCKDLLEIEGLVGLDSLELLMMKNCGSLSKIGEICRLRKLKELRLTDYSMLSKIESLEGLDSLELLTLKGCKSLRKIPELSDLKKLRVLEMEDCEKLLEIEGLVGLDSLELLTMKNCGSLSKMGKISSMRKLKELILTDCSKLSEIESLEGLDSLELLTIEGCKSLKKIPELSDMKNLRALEMEGCEELHEIEGLKGLDHLELLTIKRCKSLRKIPELANLKRLMVLEMEGCEELREIKGLEGLDSLELLTMINCGSPLVIWKILCLRKLKELRLTNYTMLSVIEILQGLDFLEHLTIHQCPETPCHASGFESIGFRKLPKSSNLQRLRVLEMEGCEDSLQIEGLVGLHSLERLKIKRCKSLGKILELSDLRKLIALEVVDCEMLLELEGLVGLDSLELLSIKLCESLVKISKLSALKKLRMLEIMNCRNLSWIEGLEDSESLAKLSLIDCSLILLDLSNLKNLTEVKVQNLKYVTEIQFCDRLELLEILNIDGCNSMQILQDLSNVKNLKHLSITYCFNLKEIQGLDRLESLELLEIRMCTSMNRLPDLSNLRNLKDLHIVECFNLKEIQGLDRLESLETLDVRMCTSLNRLPDLSNLRNLKYLYTDIAQSKGDSGPRPVGILRDLGH